MALCIELDTNSAESWLTPEKSSEKYPRSALRSAVPSQAPHCRIALMAVPNPEELPELRLSRPAAGERSSWIPWVVAGGVVAISFAVLIIMGGPRHRAEQPGGSGLAAADPYAAKLPLSDMKMSEASNFAGGKVTYLDGKVTNRGDKMLTGVTVQVAFRNALGETAQKETLPLNLIRVHEPYVDTQPVSAAPIKPGEEREFRLIFDHVAADWNQEFPETRVIHIEAK